MAVPPGKGTKANGDPASKSSPAFEIVPPADTPEYMWPAYFSCLQWAATHDEIQKHFTAETGVKFSPPKNGFEVMIDQACGRDPGLVFLRALIPWFNENVWGPMDGPPDLEVGTDG